MLGFAHGVIEARRKYNWSIANMLTTPQYGRPGIDKMIFQIPDKYAKISEERRRVYHITIDEGINKLSDFIP